MFREVQILVIGDLILDKYIGGIIERISPEAPCPVFSKNSVTNQLGGAANVAAQLKRLGANVILAGCVANDEDGKALIDIAKDKHISTELISLDKTKTTVKSRFIANTHQQVLRLDEEQIENGAIEFYENLYSYIKEHQLDLNVVVLSDYEKGVLSIDTTQRLIKLCNHLGIPSIVDIKSADSKKYEGATIIKGNEKEFSQMFSFAVNEIVDTEIIKNIRHQLNTEVIVITLGKKGLIACVADNIHRFSSSERNIYDVTGAGDIVTAYISYLFTQNYQMSDILDLANRAAGIKVESLGNTTVALEDVLCNKVRSVEQLKDVIKNKKIVFTNGCFDIIHSGHITLLKEAAEHGDVLIVGLNSDDSVKRLKGNNRPINNIDSRINVLSAISYVDYIVVFEEDTPIDIIKYLKPDCLVKGGDYVIDNIVGSDYVESYGGNVCIIPFREDISTTSIINKTKSF